MKRISLICIGLVLAVTSLYGADGSAHLYNGVTSWPRALGDNFVAEAVGTDAIYWNPAGLTVVDYPELTATSYQAYNVAFQEASISRKIKRLSLGLSYRSVSIDDLSQSNYNFQSVIEDNVSDSSRFTGDTLFLSTGIALFKGISIGVTSKLINETAASQSSSATAFDAGVLWRLNKHLKVGASIQNIGNPELEWDSGDLDNIPQIVRAGAALTMINNRLTLVGDVMKRENEAVRGGAGMEWYLLDHLTVRGGVQKQKKALDTILSEIRDLDGVSFGLGLKLYPLVLDFAWVKEEGETDETYRITLGFQLRD